MGIMTTLNNWKIIERGGGLALTGQVNGDDRWEDGTSITTSEIDSIDRGSSFTHAYTKNSSYSLLTPEEEWFEEAGGSSTAFWTKIKGLLGKKFTGIQRLKKEGGAEYI